MTNIREKVKGRLVLEVLMENISPLLISSGNEGEWCDVEVLKDAWGKIFIPGSTLAGVFRHLSQQYGEGDGSFGSQDCQSALIFSDAICLNSEPCISIRDGVSININTGTAEDKKKFDYELVEPGEQFAFNIQVRLLENKNWPSEAQLKKDFEYCAALIETGLAKFGRMTTKGFGCMKLISARTVTLDYRNREHVISWLAGNFQHLMQELSIKDTVEKLTHAAEKQNFVIDAWLDISNSLIVRGYPSLMEATDAVNISYSKEKDGNKQWVLPGTSIKGALRHRAIRIINTISNKEDHGRSVIENLMGHVHVDEKRKTKSRSRLTIEEHVIEDVVAELQMRIKVDRFTCGVIEGALFDSTPLWHMLGKEGPIVHIKMTAQNICDWEKGLLMLLLKDLWTEDLALGGEKNVGRGLLKGVTAIVNDGGLLLTIKAMAANDSKKLSLAGTLDIERTEQYVQALHTEICGREELLVNDQASNTGDL